MRTFVIRFDFNCRMKKVVTVLFPMPFENTLMISNSILINQILYICTHQLDYLYGEPLSKGPEVAVTAPGVPIQNQLKLDRIQN